MMKKLFKNKSFVLYFQGALVSAIGTSLYGFAAGLYIQDLFGENGGAIYLAAFMATSILVRIVASPFAGVWVDKLNKVRIIYLTDFIRGGLFFLTLYVLTLGLSNENLMIFLLIITGLASLNQAFFGPAGTAVLPEVVGNEMLQAANGANSIIGSIQSIFGIIAGMVLYELVGFEIAVLINAISFMLSGFSEMFIRTKYKEDIEPSDEEKTFFGDIKFGFKYLWNRDGLFTMMLFSLALNFAFSPFFGVGFPYLFRTELGKSAYHLGATEIVFSIAMLFAGVTVGSMKFKSLKSTVKKGLFGMTGTVAIMALIITLLTYGYIGYTVFYIIFILLNIVLAVAMIVTNVPLNTGMMKAIEPQVRGRVFSTISAMSGGMIPVAVIIAGFVVDRYNVAVLGILCTLVLILPTFGITKSKEVNKFFDVIEDIERVEEEKRLTELETQTSN